MPESRKEAVKAELQRLVDTGIILPVYERADWVSQISIAEKKSGTVEPRFDEVAGDRPNLFVKWRVRYIENFDITNLGGNDRNVRHVEVIANDWFVTQVTSVEIL